MADVLPIEPAVDARLRDFLAAELRQAELDFPRLRRRPRSLDGSRPRIPAIAVAAVGAVLLALIALGPRLSTGTIGGSAAPQPSASALALAAGSNAIPALPGRSPTPSPTASPTPSDPPGVLVDCGRISPKACATSIELIRARHAADVAGATQIIMDDTCTPRAACDRLYPFDAIVVFVTAGADTTGWYAFSVVGLEYDTPTTVRPWAGDIPTHVVRMLTGEQPSS